MNDWNALAATPSSAPCIAEAPAASALSQLDARLGALTHALQGRDAQALLMAAEQLVTTLDAASPMWRTAGGMTPALRRQLADAVGRVAAHREALARASASVDRAIAVLLPAAPSAATTYSAAGYTERQATAGSAWA